MSGLLVILADFLSQNPTLAYCTVSLVSIEFQQTSVYR